MFARRIRVVAIKSWQDTMIEYVEVEEPREFSSLAKSLFAKLRAKLTCSETRNIGVPSGTYRRKVYFEPNRADGALYWSGGLSKNRRVAFSLFGHGTPGASAQLLIWVQFNVPVATFSRRFGGAFLRHLPTNQIVLAHRGIVTLGHGRVIQSNVFRDMDATLREAETSMGIRNFLLIGELDSSSLVEDISQFAMDLRRVVQEPTITDEMPRKNPTGRLGELRDYFDEFSGERSVRARRQTVADCYHGAVVRALRSAFKSAPQVLKSREIDLTVITSKRAFLFEAKTSATSQHIYTAIGQLTAHAPVVAKYAKRLPLAKVIVLPVKPSQCYTQLLTKTLDISIVTFRRSAQGRISFEGLDALT
jgi:hypothetical protein